MIRMQIAVFSDWAGVAVKVDRMVASMLIGLPEAALLMKASDEDTLLKWPISKKGE
jgi:hypothetical protein